MTTFPYKDVFRNVESTLRDVCALKGDKFDGRYRGIGSKNYTLLSDQDCFQVLALVPFYSGFKSAIVEQKEPLLRSLFCDAPTVAQYDEIKVAEILNKPKMIRNHKKVAATVDNAKTFLDICQKYGNFKSFIASYEPFDQFENILLLKERLQSSFAYLGGITVFHFMTDLGLPVLKPDRVIMRIFQRLGLIGSSTAYLNAIIHGRKFSEATKEPIRYIDIVFVKYGQLGKSEMFGLENGICLEKNPSCNLCRIQKYCNFKNN